METFDLVQLKVENEEYAKEGVHQGMRGLLWNNEHKGDRWLVKFPLFKNGKDFAEIYIKDEDLRLITSFEQIANNQKI